MRLNTCQDIGKQESKTFLRSEVGATSFKLYLLVANIVAAPTPSTPMPTAHPRPPTQNLLDR